MNPPARLSSITRASSVIASAGSESGSLVTSGTPASAASRIRASSGTLPSIGTPSSPARWAPPPEPNISDVMFSTTPTTRMPVFCAITAAREATSWASGCGVVTMIASARGKSWPSEIETSPVPGGMSTTSTSRSPQCTSCRNCSSARCSIGPRHITGWLSSSKNPIDISRRSCATGGRSSRRRRPASARSRACAGSSARDVGVEDPDLVPQRGERRRDVHGQRRLPDTALARGDREHPRLR